MTLNVRSTLEHGCVSGASKPHGLLREIINELTQIYKWHSS